MISPFLNVGFAQYSINILTYIQHKQLPQTIKNGPQDLKHQCIKRCFSIYLIVRGLNVWVLKAMPG